MSSNPFTDYQEQFFKMWNDNMEKMMDSEPYKAMTKNIPGADMYAKAMESMVPQVENYWKTMASSVPGADYWEKMMEGMPGVDYWKQMMGGMPGMDYWKKMMDGMPGMTEYWNKMMGSMPGMDYWKKMMDSMPDMNYWKKMMDGMPDVTEYWKSYTNMIPGFTSYWDAFAKMMPDPSKFANLAPFKLPGLDSFTKIFDMWKAFGDPNAFASDYQKKYMDVLGNVMKSLLPENMQVFAIKPMDFMDSMVEYYKQFVSPWLEIDPDIMDRLAKGDMHAYVDFFHDYQEKYQESLEKYFTFMGMGLNREASADYMNALNTWNKSTISMGELMAVIMETGADSFQQIGEKVQADLEAGVSLTTFRDFYKVWYTVTEAAYEKLLATEEFAKVFDDFSDKYAQYMIAQNKVYERMLASLPIPTDTDMKALYKTVYDLRKEVRDLKRALDSKEDKKGDK